jgi:lysophospholipase L1-like esterase
MLQRRGNRVFVVVGPFNEHMLTPENRAIYADRKAAVAAWLAENKVPHVVAAVLPSEFYADASHPLAEGYAAMAKQLMAAEGFFKGGAAGSP